MTLSQAMQRGESKSLRVAHNFGGPTAIEDAVAAAHRFARAAALDGAVTARLAIIVEELIANVIEHGEPGPGDLVELTLARLGGEVSLILEDRGQAFDPRLRQRPDALPERGGGAGLALVNAWTRILSYESAEAGNRLELIIPLEQSLAGGSADADDGPKGV